MWCFIYRMQIKYVRDINVINRIIWDGKGIEKLE